MDAETLTERTAADIREEPHKGGYIAPCDGFVWPDAVPAHAATCAECRKIVAEAYQ